MRFYLLLFALISFSVFGQKNRKNIWNTAQYLRPHPLNVSQGVLYRYELPFCDTTRTVDVYIPSDYNVQQKVKTLYMHDGQMLFDSTQTWNKQEWGVDELFGKQLKGLQYPPFIVVGIYNDPPNRYAEFFPQKVADYMPDSYRNQLLSKLWNGQLRADAYLNWIEDTLVPFIEHACVNVSTKTKDRMVLGSSMGGLISLYALCEKPKLFGAAACLSIHTPMINFGMFEEGMVEAMVIPFNIYLEQELKADKKHKLYIDRGTETLDAYYAPYHDRLLNTLARIGYNTQSPRFLEAIIQGAAHDEKSWAKRLDVPILFMLTDNRSQ